MAAPTSAKPDQAQGQWLWTRRDLPIFRALSATLARASAGVFIGEIECAQGRVALRRGLSPLIAGAAPRALVVRLGDSMQACFAKLDANDLAGTSMIVSANCCTKQTIPRAWLTANPAHPLRDLVELWQVRLRYFSGDTEAAWASLFQLRARRPVRALAEMRFLVQQGLQPSDAQLEGLRDPLLVALFTDTKSAAGPRWQRWWRLSQQANDGAGLALQERLLQVVAESTATGALPPLTSKRGPVLFTRYALMWSGSKPTRLLQNARQVLAEADRTYVLLQACGGWPDLFWERHLAQHELTLRLRQVGKRLRAKP